jgi:hypothetical protein
MTRNEGAIVWLLPSVMGTLLLLTVFPCQTLAFSLFAMPSNLHCIAASAAATTRTLHLHASVDTTSATTTTSVTSSNLELPGVIEFETWLKSLPGAALDPSIAHWTFHGLRGLAWTARTATASRNDASDDRKNHSGLFSGSKQRAVVAKIPKQAVLTSDFTSPNWDRDLAVQLWNAVLVDRDSSNIGTNGYCLLLTQGLGDWKGPEAVPPSTAPHSLRRWSQEEKVLLLEPSRLQLSAATAGQKLLDVEQEQTARWRDMYDSLDESSAKARMGWEQFQWVMEVVHSRAFCGVIAPSLVSGSSIGQMLPSMAAPVVAAAVGYGYTLNNPAPSDTVLAALAVCAALPALLSSFLFQLKEARMASSAVLLPLIDSANHMESADSSIDYNPINGTFELSIGPNCLVPVDGQMQLFVSYGPKSDMELLLNYGFLPDVPVNAEDYRRKLAETFKARNL